MKWIFRLQNKRKSAILLMVIVSTFIVCSFWEKAIITNINKSFSSIYKDRLIPAAELFHINDHLYSKRLILEKYLLDPTFYDIKRVKEQLTAHNLQVDSIICEYEKTLLIDEESKSLQSFKNKISQYNQLETAYVTNTSLSGHKHAYEGKLVPLFNEIRYELIVLSRIQTSVGSQLFHTCEVNAGNASIIHYLQIGVVVLITLVIQALLMNAKSIIPKKPQNFRLN